MAWVRDAAGKLVQISCHWGQAEHDGPWFYGDSLNGKWIECEKEGFWWLYLDHPNWYYFIIFLIVAAIFAIVLGIASSFDTEVARAASTEPPPEPAPEPEPEPPIESHIDLEWFVRDKLEPAVEPEGLPKVRKTILTFDQEKTDDGIVVRAYLLLSPEDVAIIED